MTVIDDNYVTSKTASEILGISYSTLRQLRHKDSGPPYLRESGRCYYRIECLLEWKRANIGKTIIPRKKIQTREV